MKPGNWIRYYSNSLRDHTHLSEVTKVYYTDGAPCAVDSTDARGVRLSDITQVWESEEACRAAIEAEQRLRDKE